jgi:methenyltetrahydromethanopterin cyclohydrolase
MTDEMDEIDETDEMPPLLNELAWDLVQQAMNVADDLRIEPVDHESGACILDFGVEAQGSIGAGLALAEVCLASLAEVAIHPGEVAGVGWPHLFVQTDSPLEACLLSQYAGWKVSVGKYFAMGSGPMRAAYASEEIFKELDYREAAHGVVGVLESSKLPTKAVVAEIAKKCGVDPEQVALLVAPTASLAGNMQVVARSVETALHKLHTLGFDITRVECGSGTAPIPPVAAEDMSGIGRTNDAVLYGGRVTLWVNGDDDDLLTLGPKVPSSASPAYGQPFLKIFEAAGRDFYKIDPLLFSPAEVVIHNVDTGRVHVFGRVNHDVLRESFGF